jgi:hypothetical protein
MVQSRRWRAGRGCDESVKGHLGSDLLILSPEYMVLTADN